jgi:acetolactate synthase-1/2/3 large subunit
VEKVRLADYVAQMLADHGVQDVFLVTGGGAMHLNDAMGRSASLRVTCFHHEQAAAMAAESYFRLTNRMAALNVTTGPGGMNAINGVAGAWYDSMGMIVVSGQVKRETLVASTGLPLRQFGEQETDIVSMVSGITKYAVLVTDPSSIRYHLERALHLAVAGRPGPCWIDIPVDVQAASIDPDALAGYDPAEDAMMTEGTADVAAAAAELVERLDRAERPVIYAGAGIRTAGALGDFADLVDHLGIPVVTALNAHDLLGDDPCVVGRPGILGDRAGNFAVQNADFLLVLGTRLKIGQVGYDKDTFARAATVAMVDIDAAEMQKPSFHVDLPVHAHLGDLVPALRKATIGRDAGHGAWLAWCQERRERYPVVLPEYRAVDQPINPYCAMESIFESLSDDAVVVAGNGWAGNAAAQAGWLHFGQRLYSNGGCGSMGHDLPAAIGAALAEPGRDVVCLAGDGSLQMNIQELQTVVHHRLPLKLVVIDNGGYDSIRQTQSRFFPDSPVGFDPATGISFPDLSKLAPAYGLPFERVTRLADLPAALARAMEIDGPAVCEIVVDSEQVYAPKATSRQLPDGTMVSAPLEDMAPFLSDEELASNMLIPTLR